MACCPGTGRTWGVTPCPPVSRYRLVWRSSVSPKPNRFHAEITEGANLSTEDGRNPKWPVGLVPLDLWGAVIERGALTGPEVGRLRVALDTLHDADLLALVKGGEMQDRDVIAAYAGVRAARKAASDLVAELTGGGPARPAARPRMARCTATARSGRSRSETTAHRPQRTTDGIPPDRQLRLNKAVAWQDFDRAPGHWREPGQCLERFERRHPNPHRTPRARTDRGGHPTGEGRTTPTPRSLPRCGLNRCLPTS